jgi:hypothetical protein
VIVNKYQNIVMPGNEDLKKYQNKFYYELHFTNKGGLVMPIIIQWNYKDGTNEVEYINAYIWRKNESKVIKTFAKDKEVASITLDPFKETADIDESNNSWPASVPLSHFDLFKSKTTNRGEDTETNPMRKSLKEKK